MKIRKVKWQNHPVLGNIELDFTRSDGTVFDNIVLIGENGSGKTTVMESIATFLNIGPFDDFEYLEYEIGTQFYRALHRDGTQGNDTFFRIQDMMTGEIRIINRDRVYGPDHISSDKTDPRHYGCSISKARANYKTDKIKHTSTSELDGNKYSEDNDDNFTSLKQMFVDIVSQDEHDYTIINEGKDHADTITVQEFRLNQSKQYRFVRAFDAFFSDRGLRYGEVNNDEGNKEIFFNRGDKKIPIDNLSTGEKQIVYRGMYLLRNLKILSETVVFVDEPELSMHPRWQAKILTYYQNMFNAADGHQMAQMFFATHSEHVLRSALKASDKNLVIMLHDNNGTIECKRITAPFVLKTISFSEINYEAFRMISTDYHTALYYFLHTLSGANSIKDVDDFIKKHLFYNSKIHSRPSKGLGATTYETLPTFIRNGIDHPESGNSFSEEDLWISIDLLRRICITP